MIDDGLKDEVMVYILRPLIRASTQKHAQIIFLVHGSADHSHFFTIFGNSFLQNFVLFFLLDCIVSSTKNVG